MYVLMSEIGCSTSMRLIQLLQVRSLTDNSQTYYYILIAPFVFFFNKIHVAVLLL